MVIFVHIESVAQFHVVIIVNRTNKIVCTLATKPEACFSQNNAKYLTIDYRAVQEIMMFLSLVLEGDHNLTGGPVLLNQLSIAAVLQHRCIAGVTQM